MSIHCDCQTVIAIIKNKIFNGKNRHICLRHIVKQLLKDRIILIYYIILQVNLVDPLTKYLEKNTNK